MALGSPWSDTTNEQSCTVISYSSSILCCSWSEGVLRTGEIADHFLGLPTCCRPERFGEKPMPRNQAELPKWCRPRPLAAGKADCLELPEVAWPSVLAIIRLFSGVI